MGIAADSEEAEANRCEAILGSDVERESTGEGECECVLKRPSKDQNTKSKTKGLSRHTSEINLISISQENFNPNTKKHTK